MAKNDVLEMIIRCNDLGVVAEVVYPTWDVSDYFMVDQSFTYHVHPKSFTKALSFMMTITSNGLASNYELNFNLDNKPEILYLSGVLKDEEILILASRRNILDSDTDEMMRINNEQMNAFRSLIREMQVKSKKKEDELAYHYNEISKLNNELINSQRELAQKNEQLNRLNDQLERLATRDSLTGLYNRRLLAERYESEIKRAKRQGTIVTLVNIDINNFKRVNDELGHQAGDELLINFAQIATSLTRDGVDYVFRMGGDEFLLLLTDCDVAVASAVLKRLDAAFAQKTDLASLAYGVLRINPEDDIELDEAVRRSDDLMFKNKSERKEFRE